jgi:hypothetical protein
VAGAAVLVEARQRQLARTAIADPHVGGRRAAVAGFDLGGAERLELAVDGLTNEVGELAAVVLEGGLDSCSSVTVTGVSL